MINFYLFIFDLFRILVHSPIFRLVSWPPDPFGCLEVVVVFVVIVFVVVFVVAVIGLLVPDLGAKGVVPGVVNGERSKIVSSLFNFC